MTVEQIHFLLNLHIYIINIIIVIIYKVIFQIELQEINTTSEFITKISQINKNSLFISSFILFYSFCLLITVENMNPTSVTNLIFSSFYFLLLIITVYNNYQICLIINEEKTNYFFKEFAIPHIELEKMEYLYYIIQGLFSFILLLLVFKIAIAFLRKYEEYLLRYYENGQMFLFFEMRQNII